MQLSPNQNNFLKVPQPFSSNPLQTPTKKGKSDFHSNLKTAESPNVPQSASKLSIADIDAEQLFQNFSRIVTVSQSNQEFESECPYRHLQFDKENSKLMFDFSTNSMKKKRRGSRMIPQISGQSVKIKPFVLNEVVCTHSEDNDVNENTEMVQENNEGLNMRGDGQMNDLSPGLRRRTSKTGVMSTPTKKPIRVVDIDRAAKKQDAFRDLRTKGPDNA